MISQSKLEKYYKILAKVTDANGISGHENNVVSVILKEIKPYISSYSYCGQGSLIVHAKNNSAKNKHTIMLDTHMDEVGLMVSMILDNGYLKVIPIGGLWGHVLAAQKYFIILRDGCKIPAIVGNIPIHVLKANLQNKVVLPEEMYLDIGVENKEEAIKLGINVGDPVFKDNPLFKMGNPKFVCGKALDNRYSCATQISIFESLSKEKLNFNVVGVFSCQEEVGLRGVKTATHHINPDVGIVIDTTVSNDQKELKNYNDCALGKGAVLSIADSYINSDINWMNFLKRVAKKNNIPYAYNASLGGGTNGGYVYLANKGVATVVISLPTRYLHTHCEVANIEDGINAAKLVVESLRHLNNEEIITNLLKKYHD